MNIDSRVRLTRMVSSHSILRTDEVIGTVIQPPVVGHSFIMVAKSLCEDKDFRYVETSEIQHINIKDGIWTIKTLNSEYKLEKLY